MAEILKIGSLFILAIAFGAIGVYSLFLMKDMGEDKFSEVENAD